MRPAELRRVKLLSFGGLAALILSLGLLLLSSQITVAAETEQERMSRLVEGAKKEGALLWYTSMEMEGAEAFVKKFREKYPFIDAKAFRAISDQVINRILAEHQAKKIMVDAGEIGGISDAILKKRGVLTRYVSPEAKFYPDIYRDPEGYWTVVYTQHLVVGYNTNLVSLKDAPKTYEDLLKPLWKGKMGMLTNAQEWFTGLLRLWGEKKGLDYFRKLAAQDLQWREGATLNSQLVASGELTIALPLYNFRIQEMKQQGMPIEWVALEPVNAQIHPLWVTEHAPHPNAARLFVDFALSKEGQQAITTICRRIPARTDVEAADPRLKVPGLKVFVADFQNFVDDYDSYLKLFREILVLKK